VQLPRGPVEFRTTAVKPFLQEASESESESNPESSPNPDQAKESPQTEQEDRPQRTK
jgi:hypothetical protein